MTNYNQLLSSSLSLLNIPLVLPKLNINKIQQFNYPMNQINTIAIPFKNQNNSNKKKATYIKKKFDPSLEIPNKPKFENDFYTPRFVKGRGLNRIGKCPCCPQQPGTWYRTKTSAYSYHLSSSHGISSSTLKPYDKPTKYRIIYIDKISKNQNEIIFSTLLKEDNTITISDSYDITSKLWPSPYPAMDYVISKDAYCNKCNQWIILKSNALSIKRLYKQWWKHQRLCSNFNRQESSFS
ncbi:hypothetical protein BCR36DRAFT_413618 [Piromyces finnis]|uniref:Transcription regulator Rua1 C-terminal domain-containing protein n=1 Tax=Piromyces finnis TaxID=1754191 RepID=A0A1Y1V4N1_9FUNG|nr:hypothetical protein BCR36DRAFT_413618 [Piromyces finnis]|eukprot:ORX47266.1 hypothetical protein BCR36DRAFT_413618 [Piromyces finnis]